MQGGIHTGQTALHLAAETQNKAMCELLYENGALLNVKDAMGFTPLDTVLFMFDPSVDVFSNQKIKPKMTEREGNHRLPAQQKSKKHDRQAT